MNAIAGHTVDRLTLLGQHCNMTNVRQCVPRLILYSAIPQNEISVMDIRYIPVVNYKERSGKRSI